MASLGEALDALHVDALCVMHQRDGNPVATGTTGAADSVDVVLGELRQIS